MGVIKDKLQNIVDTNNVTRYGDTIAIITSYDNIKNTASIRFTNPNGGTMLTANNIAFKINSGGLTQATPATGQKCWISFLSNNLLTPVITSLCDDEYYTNIYSKKTNADQGAYLVNNSINNIDIDSIEVTAMTNDYIDNSDSSKYSITKDYTNTDATEEARSTLMQLDKYKSSEDGITNLSTNSTVKFKENGDIDIFVGNNTGIRINPNDKSISFFGKSISTMATESWTIDVPNVKIKGNLEITGELKTGGES
jgi:hypothetical protein